QVPERFKENPDTSQNEEKEEGPSGNDSTEQAGRATVGKKEEEERFTDNLVFGGNAGLSFGNYTYLLLAPSVGYKVNKSLIPGVGFIYQYAKINSVYDYTSQRMIRVEGYENQVYGPKAFLNYIPTDFLMLGTQVEVLNHDVPVSVNSRTGIINFEM